MDYEIIKKFPIEGEPVSAKAFGSGHISDTYLVTTDAGRRYIFQRLGDALDADILMANIHAITAECMRKSDGAGEFLHFLRDIDGNPYYKDETGNYRMYEFVEDTITLEEPETIEDCYQAALGFGKFHKMLCDFPAETLSESIPDFHNTVKRYADFHEALLGGDPMRIAAVLPEINFVLEREFDAGELCSMRESGKLPVRVTHNDAKMSNVLLREDTHEAVCAIDLDTVMPGLIAYDFGDMIRSGASASAEDEHDLDKIKIDLERVRMFARGFLCDCQMSPAEVDSLALGAKIITLEQVVRFLGDYINGDIYYKTHYPDQNLYRTRAQIRLVEEIEAHWDEIVNIIRQEA